MYINISEYKNLTSESCCKKNKQTLQAVGAGICTIPHQSLTWTGVRPKIINPRFIFSRCHDNVTAHAVAQLHVI